VIAPVSEFEVLVRAGTPLSRSQAEAVLASPDLVGVGSLGELARRTATGDRVAFGRVCLLAAGDRSIDPGAAGEVRLAGAPASADEARARVRDAAPMAGRAPLTGFSLADLLALAGSDHLALADLARALRADGLEAVAEAPLDALGDTDNALEVVRAARHGGLEVRRATIGAASIGRRLDLIERAVIVQAETAAFKAFAPLPRFDPADSPATGYDDVRTIAVARLMCATIPFIQVDWPLYGPKLAQVAIAYGANDIDGIAAADAAGLGPRRSPREDIERQIRASGGTPVERDGRYEVRA
jgi:aminodeoxyfutalosine synthase